MLASRTVSSIARRLPLKAKPLANRSFSVAATRGMVRSQVNPSPASPFQPATGIEGEIVTEVANAFSDHAAGRYDLQPGEKKGKIIPFDGA